VLRTARGTAVGCRPIDIRHEQGQARDEASGAVMPRVAVWSRP